LSEAGAAKFYPGAREFMQGMLGLTNPIEYSAGGVLGELSP